MGLGTVTIWYGLLTYFLSPPDPQSSGVSNACLIYLPMCVGLGGKDQSHRLGLKVVEGL